MKKYLMGLIGTSLFGIIVFSVAQAAPTGPKMSMNLDSVSEKCSKKSVRVLGTTVSADETLDGSYPISALADTDFNRLASVILQGCKITVVIGKMENSRRVTYQCLSATQFGKYFRCYSIGALSETEADGSAADLIHPSVTIHEVGGESAVSDIPSSPSGFALSLRGVSASTGTSGPGDALDLDSPGSTTELNIFATK